MVTFPVALLTAIPGPAMIELTTAGIEKIKERKASSKLANFSCGLAPVSPVSEVIRPHQSGDPSNADMVVMPFESITALLALKGAPEEVPSDPAISQLFVFFVIV